MRGSFVGTNIVASRIEREEMPNPLEVEFRGLVEAEDAPISVTILDNVLSDNNAATVYTDENDNVITEAAFYAAIVVESIVEAKRNNFSSILSPVDEFDIEDL